MIARKAASDDVHPKKHILVIDYLTLRGMPRCFLA